MILDAPVLSEKLDPGLPPLLIPATLDALLAESGVEPIGEIPNCGVYALGAFQNPLLTARACMICGP
jgi:hypothetical protein